jgi:DNA-binding NarL/FixJ family response regulator
LDPLHVLLVTDDPGLAKGFSEALAEHSQLADVEAVRPDASLDASSTEADLIILDSGAPPSERKLSSDSLVLRVRDEGEEPDDLRLHSYLREHGYVRREDLAEIAPVIVALAGLSRAAGKRAPR